MFKFDNGLYWANKYGHLQWGIEIAKEFNFYYNNFNFNSELCLGFFVINWINNN